MKWQWIIVIVVFAFIILNLRKIRLYIYNFWFNQGIRGEWWRDFERRWGRMAPIILILSIACVIANFFDIIELPDKLKNVGKYLTDEKPPEKKPLRVGKGKLCVKREPSNALVCVQNQKTFLNITTPPTLCCINLDAGEYHVKVSKQGYKTENSRINIEAGKIVEVQFTLKK